jgi:hypothetical protein
LTGIPFKFSVDGFELRLPAGSAWEEFPAEAPAERVSEKNDAGATPEGPGAGVGEPVLPSVAPAELPVAAGLLVAFDPSEVFPLVFEGAPLPAGGGA